MVCTLFVNGWFLFRVLQVLYYEPVHFQIGVCTLIGCKPSIFFIIAIKDNYLILVIQTYATYCYNLLIIVHNSNNAV